MAVQFASKEGTYPQIELEHLRSVDVCRSSTGWVRDSIHCSVSNGYHTCFPHQNNSSQSMWRDDFCLEEEVLDSSSRLKLARFLAYRAGAVKLSAEVLSVIATEIMHDLVTLAFSAFKASLDEFVRAAREVEMEERDCFSIIRVDSEVDSDESSVSESESSLEELEDEEESGSDEDDEESGDNQG